MPDITVSLTVPQINRLKEAFATVENPDPGIDDIKALIVRFLRGKVHAKEHSRSMAQIINTPFDPA